MPEQSENTAVKRAIDAMDDAISEIAREEALRRQEQKRQLLYTANVDVAEQQRIQREQDALAEYQSVVDQHFPDPYEQIDMLESFVGHKQLFGELSVFAKKVVNNRLEVTAFDLEKQIAEVNSRRYELPSEQPPQETPAANEDAFSVRVKLPNGVTIRRSKNF